MPRLAARALTLTLTLAQSPARQHLPLRKSQFSTQPYDMLLSPPFGALGWCTYCGSMTHDCLSGRGSNLLNLKSDQPLILYVYYPPVLNPHQVQDVESRRHAQHSTVLHMDSVQVLLDPIIMAWVHGRER